MADVEEAVGGRAGVGRPLPGRVALRGPVRDPDHPLHYVVYVGEVPAELALVVDVDGLAAQDGAHELEQRHVRSPPGAVDGEEAQASGGQPVEVGVGVGHQFVGLLARGIEGDGVIHPVRGLERHLLVEAINRAGGGVDQVLHPVMAAPLQHREGAVEIAVGVGEGVVQRIAHPGLGPQVDHPIEPLAGKERRHGCAIGEVHPLEAKTGQWQQQGQPRLLQADLVVVVEVVQANHLMAVAAEPLRHMEADEAGGAGDQIFHCCCSSHSPAARLSPRPMA